MKRARFITLLAIGSPLFLAARAAAVPTAEASLQACQEKVRTEGKRFVQNTVNAVGTCLKQVSVDVIKNNVPISTATSKTCVTQFRKLNDTRINDQSIEEKFKDNVDKKCQPGFSPSVTHALNDITAQAVGGVTEKIKTVNADTWCKHFGGDGSIDTLAEWEDCMVASFNCQAAAAIASEFPRASEWLSSLISAPNMPAVPAPGSDLSKTTDAVSGASDMRDLIDPDGDGIPSPRCGGEGVPCASACCYIENLAVGGDAQCFEYTGNAAQVAAFQISCLNGVSPPAIGVPGSSVGAMVHSVAAFPLPCSAGPSPGYGVPCVAGPPGVGNLHVMPKDSSCP